MLTWYLHEGCYFLPSNTVAWSISGTFKDLTRFLLTLGRAGRRGYTTRGACIPFHRQSLDARLLFSILRAVRWLSEANMRCLQTAVRLKFGRPQYGKHPIAVLRACTRAPYRRATNGFLGPTWPPTEPTSLNGSQRRPQGPQRHTGGTPSIDSWISTRSTGYQP